MVSRWTQLTFARAFSYTTLGQRAIVAGNNANADLSKSPSQVDNTITADSSVTAYVTFREHDNFGKVGYSTLIQIPGARGIKEAIDELIKLFGEGKDTNDPYVAHLQQFIRDAEARVEWIFDNGWAVSE